MTTAAGPVVLEPHRPGDCQRPAKRKAQGVASSRSTSSPARTWSAVPPAGHVFNAPGEEDKARLKPTSASVDSLLTASFRYRLPLLNDPLEVTVETFSERIVDKTQFKGESTTLGRNSMR